MGLLDVLLGENNSTEKFAQTVSPSPPSSPADGKTGDEGGDGATFRAPFSEDKKIVNRGLAFPHCPHCLSYYLYRRNNQGNYQCESCGFEDISETVARRTQ